MFPPSRFFLPVFLLLAGCVSFRPHPLSPGQSAAALSGRSLGGRTWSLAALEAEAVKTAPDVAVARAQYETARAAIATAGERPNPTVSIAPQFAAPISALIEGTYGVDFDWTVETAGKRTKRLSVAHENARAAAARVVDAAWKTRAAVRQALLELYAGEERTRLATEAVARQDELLKAYETRIQAGEESRAIAAQPRLLQTQLRLQAADATRAAALGRASLAAALGLGVAGLAEAHFSYTAFERTSGLPSSVRRSALTHRADVLAALADYAAAEATLRLEIAKQYPDLHLQPGYAFDQGVNKWAVGLTLTLPILNQNRGPIGEAEARRKEAAARFQAVQAKVLAECDRAASTVSAARAKLAVTDQLLSEQARLVESEQHRVTAGGGDKLSLLSAQVERATTLTARLDATVELQAALGALELATQTPLEK